MPEFISTGYGSARHADGWSVEYSGRWQVIYEEADRRAELEIEHGFESETIYPDTLRWTSPVQRDATSEERASIGNRVASALHFISGKSIEVSPGRA
jgi:hypothetical protein